VEASVGIHFGPVVLGDIGANRLEFAVIGSTVNIASRLEALTRQVGAPVVVSDDLVEQMRREPQHSEDSEVALAKKLPQEIRGIAEPMAVWTLNPKG
jgi:adenylate cyclase